MTVHSVSLSLSVCLCVAFLLLVHMGICGVINNAQANDANAANGMTKPLTWTDSTAGKSAIF